MQEIQAKYRPFLRWAGGKNWLVKLILPKLQQLPFNAYHEPFLGGGSMFFALCPPKAYLSDLNKDLIDTYIGLRDSPLEVTEMIKNWPVSEEQYYKVRELKCETASSRSARFIYLNKTSFNGLYRVNREGKYNVPYGHNDSYSFDFQRLEECSAALKDATISHHGFELSLGNIREGDLVFLDPPYTVSHNKNGFIEYNKTLFSLDDQNNLKEYIDKVNQLKAYYVLTNAAHPAITAIFSDKHNRCYTMGRNSLLGGAKAKRGKVNEFLFTNIYELDFEVNNV